MKRISCIWVIILLIMTGCKNNQSTDAIITIDVTKKYPKKELILQDFMDVEYIPLETNDEFFCQGIVLAVGKEVIIVKNQLNDGNLYIFDRNGKGLRKINRKGNGSEEYSFISSIILDEDNDEMFINGSNKLLVYDLFGNFKRSLPFREESSYSSVRNYNKENLICFNRSFDKKEIPDESPFFIISKQDGSILKDISIICQQKLPGMKSVEHNSFYITAYGSNSPDISVIPYQDSWILTIYSSDTTFRYLPDQSMIPFIVRTPSIESKDADSFLSPVILTDQYFFLRTEKIEPEVKGTTPQDAYLFYPKTHLMFDRQEKTIYEYTVLNNDFSDVTVDLIQKTGNDDIAFWQKIEANQLVDSYEKGGLKNRLKEIAAELDEEDNPVIMLVKYK